MAEKCCPKCGSNNINFQREQTASIGGSLHNTGSRKHHSICYWFLVAWWIWLFKMIVWIYRIVIQILTFGIFGRKKDKGINGKTISINKTINHTVAVCQDCGYAWKV